MRFSLIRIRKKPFRGKSINESFCLFLCDFCMIWFVMDKNEFSIEWNLLFFFCLSLSRIHRLHRYTQINHEKKWKKKKTDQNVSGPGVYFSLLKWFSTCVCLCICALNSTHNHFESTKRIVLVITTEKPLPLTKSFDENDKGKNPFEISLQSLIQLFIFAHNIQFAFAF